MTSEKLVKVQLDTDYLKYPATGHTVAGGVVDYMLQVTNEGNIKMENIQVIDILPWIGDVGVLDAQKRLSQWRPYLAGPVEPPIGVKVYYSTEADPCRYGLNYTAVSCVIANWYETPPADITTKYFVLFI